MSIESPLTQGRELKLVVTQAARNIGFSRPSRRGVN